MVNFHPLRVTEIRPTTEEAKVFGFEVPEHLATRYQFQHGQYLTLRATVNGEVLRRCYSICTPVGSRKLEIAIKRIPQGRFSGFAHQHIAVGDMVEVMPPLGKFYVSVAPQRARHYVCFAGGSGITPFMSIIPTIMRHEPHSRVTLFYGSRSVSRIMFRRELAGLKDQYVDRIALFHILSDERRDPDIFQGLIDQQKTKQLIERLLPGHGLDYYFMCGPVPMMDAVRAVLQQNGIPEAQQKYELFGERPHVGPTAPLETVVPGAQVCFVMNGTMRCVDSGAQGRTLLESGRAHGLDMPFSCEAGVCCTCRAKLVEGKVDMIKADGLEPDEISAGYVLTCQSRPLTQRVVVDFDR